MKRTKLILGIFFLTTVLFTSCKDTSKEKTEENMVEESTVNTVAHSSDKHFAEAIKELEAKNYMKASNYIKEGVDAIKKEGKQEAGLYKVNLDKAIQELNQIAKDLDENKMVAVTTLKEVIANAEINVAHDYLATSEVYTLESPEAKMNSLLVKRVDHNLNVLKEKQDSKIKVELNKEREMLINDGKKLEDEMKALHEKMKAHSKKMDEHIKKNYPESYDDGDNWVIN